MTPQPLSAEKAFGWRRLRPSPIAPMEGLTPLPLGDLRAPSQPGTGRTGGGDGDEHLIAQKYLPRPLLPSHFLSGRPSQMFEAPPGPRCGGGNDGEAESGTHIPNKVTSRAERSGSSWIRVCVDSGACAGAALPCPLLLSYGTSSIAQGPGTRLSGIREEREGPRGRGRGRKGEIRETSRSGRTRQTGSEQGGAGSGAPGVEGGLSAGGELQRPRLPSTRVEEWGARDPVRARASLGCAGPGSPGP